MRMTADDSVTASHWRTAEHLERVSQFTLTSQERSHPTPSGLSAPSENPPVDPCNGTPPVEDAASPFPKFPDEPKKAGASGGMPLTPANGCRSGLRLRRAGLFRRGALGACQTRGPVQHGEGPRA